MFNAESDGERLRLNVHVVAVQHGKGIARAVSNRQHQMIGCDPLAIGEHHAAYAL